MARSGGRKVRTGCRTCKLRKIKCDEANPECQKCIKIGKKCGGYDLVAPSQRSIDQKKRRLKEASLAIAMWKEDAREWPLKDLHVDKDMLRSNFEKAMLQLRDSINILNDNTFDQKTLERIVPNIQSLIIIQMCHHDLLDFPSLHPQYRLRSNIAVNTLAMERSIRRIEHAANSTILEALKYIRSVIPGTRKDSRLAPNGQMISEHPAQICTPFDQWHKELQGLIADSRNYIFQPLSKRDSLSSMEAQMKYWTAKICVYVCHYRDESVYDCFKDLFEKVVSLAKSILDSYPDTRNHADYKFDFEKSSYLTLLKFVILKYRWIGIRYGAWLILQKLATRQKKPVNYNELCDIGQRMIETEHKVQIEEVTQANVGLFPLPAEEVRVRDYTTDARFADLVTVQNVDREGLSKVQRTYTQRLLLRCGSYELNHLAEWVERILSPSETSFNLWLLDSHIQTAPMNHASSSRSSRRRYYNIEKIDFLKYHYVDCGLTWKEVEKEYNKTFSGDGGSGHGR